jgi:glycosyltransferase involved in cell wall biosynthesis
MAILEAFSAGTPIIVSDIENLNEIVTNDFNGIHFKTNNPADLLKVIEEFNFNIEKYQSLYVNAKKTYLEKYTHEINYENLIKIYNLAIDQKP